MILLLWLNACFLWITPDDLTGETGEVTDAADTVEDTVDSDALVPTWRALLTYEATRGTGSTWADATLCIDGRVDAAWYQQWVDAPTPCVVASAPPSSCLNGATVTAALHGGGADHALAWDPRGQNHNAPISPVAARTQIGLTTSAWPTGPGALELAPFLEVRPHALTLTGEVPGSGGTPLPMGTRDTVFSWTPHGADGVLVRVTGVGAPYATVRCLVDDDDGAVTVPASLFEGWEAGQSLSITVSQIYASPAPEPAETVGAGVELHSWSGWGRLP